MSPSQPLQAAPRPFLKWAGGKRQLLDQFERFLPEAAVVNRYLEPFAGSGAVFFRVRSLLFPTRTILADSNEELINVYAVIQSDVEALITLLRRHRRLHGREHYYAMRGKNPARLGETARAARFIYLNKTCFNGLYRVNSRGLFNVPMGRYVNPPILDEDNLRAVSEALRGVKLLRAPFEKTLDYARPGDFIYFDPPYHPLSDTSYFTAYTEGTFRAEDQRALARMVAELHRRGCHLMLSNSDVDPILRLYDHPEFHIGRVAARRNINSRADRRGQVSEVVITNYHPRAAAAEDAAGRRRPGRSAPQSRPALPQPRI